MTTRTTIRQQVDQDTEAARSFLSLARHFERLGDQVQAAEAHVESDYHARRAEAGFQALCDLAAASQAA